MKRAALVAGVSLAALLMAEPTPVFALSGDSNSSGFSKSGDEPKAARKSGRTAERTGRKAEPADKAPPTPTGLLHIIVSIDKQRATLFADGHPVASTAVSTGAPGHPTPMGLFTVIQKDKNHVSNLYNAAMPYMQRITWSGSALHEGPLPGYPASHGCVRLTSNFAQLIWKTTKMGARVIVTHPDVAPLDFEHAKLFVPHSKTMASVPLPQPSPLNVAAPATVPAATPAVIPASITAPVPAVTPAVVVEPALTSGIKVKTVDASHAVPVAVVAEEAKPLATPVTAEQKPNTPSAEEPTKLAETNGESTKPAEVQAAAPEPQPTEAKPVEAAEVKPAEPTPEAKPVEAATEAKAPEQTAEAKPAAEEKRADVAPVAETKPAVEEKTAEVKPVEAKPAETSAVETKAAEPKPAVEEKAAEAKPAEPAPAVVAAPPTAEEKYPTAAYQDGKPISVFASLKEGKIYVRQGWKSLFVVPVTFENPSQPIGTHLYTAMSAKADGAGLRWTVVTIPSTYKRVAENREGRRSRSAQPVKVDAAPVPPSSASVALDRLNMPEDLVERISEMWMPGSSLIVSDNRLSDETGDDTDFIVTTF